MNTPARTSEVPMRRRIGSTRWLIVIAALGALALGGCKGETAPEQAKSATRIADVLTSRPGPPHGIALEAYFQEERFKTHYRVWYRLPELARADQPSQRIRVSTTGANCGSWGGEANVFVNSRPDELRADDDYNPNVFLAARAPDGQQGAWADFVWYHPHPPCGNTPDHRDVTISITLRNPSGSFTCTYVGAATGTGVCKDNQ